MTFVLSLVQGHTQDTLDPYIYDNGLVSLSMRNSEILDNYCLCNLPYAATVASCQRSVGSQYIGHLHEDTSQNGEAKAVAVACA